MEHNNDNLERKRSVQKTTMIVLAVLTLIIILYLVYGIVTKSTDMLMFGILLGGFVVIYLVMTDIVEPYRLGLFQELTAERRSGFLKMMLMDVIGAGALLYWLFGMTDSGSSEILLPLLIYFITAQVKRKYRAELEGTLEEEAEQDASGEKAGEEESGEEKSGKEAEASACELPGENGEERASGEEDGE